jgi:hypothetical protein
MSKLQWFLSVGGIAALMFWVTPKLGLVMLPFLIYYTFFAKRDDRPAQAGYIYFLADDKAGLVKIGRTKHDPRKRIAQLQGQSPNPLRLLEQYQTDDMYLEERTLHHVFDYCRRHGEWFDLKCVHAHIFKGGGQGWVSPPPSS